MKALLVLLIPLLAGCGLFQPLQPQPQLELSLLAPASLGREVQVSQRLQFNFGERQQRMLVVWSVQAGRLQLTGLTVQGQRLFELSYDGESFSQSQQVNMPETFSARRVLQELQWAYWPSEVLAAQLQRELKTLVEGDRQREVFLANELVASFHFHGDGDFANLLLNHRDGYQLQVETLKVQSLLPAQSLVKDAKQKIVQPPAMLISTELTSTELTSANEGTYL